MGYGRHCMCTGLHFLWENKLSFKDRIFNDHCTVLAVKRVEFVSDRMSHILMRCRRLDLTLIVHAPTANRNCDADDNFYE